MNLDFKDISLDQLVDEEWLSVRSTNVCLDAGLTSLKLIIKFYFENKSFLNLRNCGVKSEKELIDICKKYSQEASHDNYFEIRIKKDSFLDTIKLLNPFQLGILYSHFNYLISKLNVRAYNGLGSISSSLNPKIIFEELFSKKFNFKKLRNIGNKSIDELEKMTIELVGFVNILQTIKADQLSKEYTKLMLKTNFNNLPVDFDEQFKEIFDGNGKIKLFSLLNFLINSDQIFSKIQQKSFEFLFTNVKNSNITIDSISKDLNITKERVRQVKSKLEEDVKSYFLFVSNFVFEDLVNYNIDNCKSFLVVDKTTSDKINDAEEVNFNVSFYSIIFDLLLKNRYKVLGNAEVIYGKGKIKAKKNYKNCYLINSLLFECFDFEKFVEDIYSKQNEKIIETYLLHFQGYLYNFINDEGKIFYKEIYSVCEAILYNEFELFITSEKYLTFERNTLKQLHEYCEDILVEFSRPMTIEEIEDVLNQKFPDLKNTTDSIRGSLIREKELFMCLSRTSTYALRKWEIEKENLKGGTIREMVEEFLETQDSPLHISIIAEYVEKYREGTYARSIIDNLKAETNTNFIFYSGYFIGLKSKYYDSKTINFKKIVGSHFSKNALHKFTNWTLNDLVYYYAKKHGYLKVQVEYLLRQKINEGTIKLSKENRIIYE